MATPKVVKETPVKAEPVVAAPAAVSDFEAPVKPTVLMSETDAYIMERVASQPKTLDEVRRVVVHTATDKNRLSLPDYFERFSYDCTQGRGCPSHPWVQAESADPNMPGKWTYGKRGEFVFRWIKKVKRAVDHAMNVVEWQFVCRQYFPDAPTHLFSANGGVELGDVILFFLPAKQALALRAVPGQRSTEAIRSRLTRVKGGEVAMSGDLDNERFYLPESAGEADGEDGSNAPGLQEGRDF